MFYSKTLRKINIFLYFCLFLIEKYCVMQEEAKSFKSNFSILFNRNQAQI